MRRASLSVVVYLGLGSNQGDREAQVLGAAPELGSRGVRPLRLSPLYASRYVGPGGPQPDYLNAVLEARTALAPLELLAVTRQVEALHGRRPGTHLLPRQLDIDILLYGTWVVRHPELVIPHPRLLQRRFVLQPLQDLGALGRSPLGCGAEHLATLERLQPLWRHAAVPDAHGGRREAVCP